MADLELVEIAGVLSNAGTLEVLAPEVINGKEYSYKADVYSMGCVLFKMLSGNYPFYSYNMNED